VKRENSEGSREDCWSVVLPGVVSRKKQLVPPLTLFGEQM